MSAWDVIRHEFEDPPHPGVPALAGATRRSCRSTCRGSGQLAYSIVFGRQRRSWTLPRGGSGALTDALVRVHRGPRRHRALRPARGAAAGRGRALRGRRDRGRRALPRLRGRRLDDPRQAPARDGAGRRVATSFRYGVETFDVGVSGDRRLHGDDRAAGVRDGGRAAQRGVRRARRLAAGRHRLRARAARRPLRRRRRRGCSSRRRRSSIPRARPRATTRSSSSARSRGSAGARDGPRAQGPAGRAPARARPRRRAELHGRRDPRVARQGPEDIEAPNRAHDPRDVPRRRPHAPAERRAAPGAGLGASTGCRSPASTRPAARRTRAARSPARPGRNAAIGAARRISDSTSRRWCPVPDARVQAAIDHWAPRFMHERRRLQRLPDARRRASSAGTTGSTRGARPAEEHVELRRGRARRRASAHRRRGVRCAPPSAYHFAQVRLGGRRRAQPRGDRPGGRRRSTPRTRCSTRRPSGSRRRSTAAASSATCAGRATSSGRRSSC